MDPVTFYTNDGREYTADTPAEIVQLRSQGLSETPPSQDEVVPQVDVQHPENHSVEDVQKFLAVNPTLTETVVEAEKARGDKARKTIVGEG